MGPLTRTAPRASRDTGAGAGLCSPARIETMFTCSKSLLLSLALAVFGAETVSATPLNGTWTVDEASSVTLESAAAARNKELKEEYRRNKKQKFSKDEQRNRSGDRFRAQLTATEGMIRENDLDIDWGGPPEVRKMLAARTIKLYQGSKAVILYDGDRRRLLAINPAGKAYSVSGMELNEDEIGRSLAFVEDGALVVETDIYNGDRVIERFECAEGSNEMTLQVRLQEGRRSPWLEYERVFRRAD
jgi:hypothetical protein